jgi:CRP/FNR family transcriptional regulator, cyclic AMP receptor protein
MQWIVLDPRADPGTLGTLGHPAARDAAPGGRRWRVDDLASTSASGGRRTFADELGVAGLQQFRDACVVRRARAGDVLCREGEVHDHAYLVERGLLMVTKMALNARQAILELRGPGDLVGELAAIDGAERSATVSVAESGQLLVIDRHALLGLVRSDGAVALALLVSLAGKVRESSDRHLELGTADGMPRVARRLIELWELRGRVADFSSPISQQELADWAGVSRDGVVRALTALRNAGVVETGRRRFVVRDVARLRTFAEAAGR